jgi:transcriptional regulator with GAF, ATPase, and Fis domain
MKSSEFPTGDRTKMTLNTQKQLLADRLREVARINRCEIKSGWTQTKNHLGHNILMNRPEAKQAYLIEEIKLVNDHEKIIGQSDGLKYVLYKVDQIAEGDTLVLILGETGTGKELVARAIHGARAGAKIGL